MMKTKKAAFAKARIAQKLFRENEKRDTLTVLRKLIQQEKFEWADSWIIEMLPLHDKVRYYLFATQLGWPPFKTDYKKFPKLRAAIKAEMASKRDSLLYTDGKLAITANIKDIKKILAYGMKLLEGKS